MATQLAVPEKEEVPTPVQEDATADVSTPNEATVYWGDWLALKLAVLCILTVFLCGLIDLISRIWPH
jgi:hypothetical protein